MFCFQPESNIPEAPDKEKHQHYTDEQGEVLPTQYSTKTAIASKVALMDMLVSIEVYAGILCFKCYLQRTSDILLFNLLIFWQPVARIQM